MVLTGSVAVNSAVERLRGKESVKVLFVCLGNICRSPAAEGVMKALVAEKHDEKRWTIDSAGTGGWHIGNLPDSRMRAHAYRRGLSLDHICRKVREGDFDDFDLIIGMDSGNISRLREIAPSPEAQSKIMCMADWFGDFSRYDCVPDPYYEGSEGFELVLDMLCDATLNLYDTLAPELAGTKV